MVDDEVELDERDVMQLVDEIIMVEREEIDVVLIYPENIIGILLVDDEDDVLVLVCLVDDDADEIIELLDMLPLATEADDDELDVQPVILVV